jgi:hypothetical protein
MISWSAENMTGGKLSAAVALTIAIDPKVIDALVAVAMLERDGRHYVIHDFGDYNPTGEQLTARREELRAKRSQAGRRGAAARWGSDRPDGKLRSAKAPLDGQSDGNLPSAKAANDAKPHGKPNGNLPSLQAPSDGKLHGKSMLTSPSPSPSPDPPPTVVTFALTRVDPTVESGDRRKSKASPTTKHTADEVASKDRIVQTFVECFTAKKHVEPKAILSVDHAKAFDLAKRFGVEESCSIVRRAFENDFVVRENATIRYIASKADTFRGVAPKKAQERREQQQVVGDEPWLREHLS